MDEDKRPLAPPERVESARRVFPYREQTPAYYAAHHAHQIGSSSFDDYRYPDAALGRWIDELHRLLRSSRELDECRRKYLTPEQYEAVARELASDEAF
jgi:hypothetical protein